MIETGLPPIDPEAHRVRIAGRSLDRYDMWDVARKLVPGITEEAFETMWQEAVGRAARRRLQ